MAGLLALRPRSMGPHVTNVQNNPGISLVSELLLIVSVFISGESQYRQNIIWSPWPGL